VRVVAEGQLREGLLHLARDAGGHLGREHAGGVLDVEGVGAHGNALTEEVNHPLHVVDGGVSLEHGPGQGGLVVAAVLQHALGDLAVVAGVVVGVEVGEDVHAGLAGLLDEGVDGVVREVAHGVDGRRAEEHGGRGVGHVCALLAEVVERVDAALPQVEHRNGAAPDLLVARLLPGLGDRRIARVDKLGDLLAMLVRHLGGAIRLLGVARGVVEDPHVTVFVGQDRVRVELAGRGFRRGVGGGFWRGAERASGGTLLRQARGARHGVPCVASGLEHRFLRSR
jgi:hypothetical protein